MSDQPFRTIVEPFRIHSVEPMRLTTRGERTAALAACPGLRGAAEPGVHPDWQTGGPRAFPGHGRPGRGR